MTAITFVTVSHPDEIHNRKIQTSIRRHVMRDIGRSRRKKPRPRIIPLEVQVATEERESVENREFGLESDYLAGETHENGLYRSPKGSGILGIELDEEALQVVQFSKSFPVDAPASCQRETLTIVTHVLILVIFCSDSSIRLPLPTLPRGVGADRPFGPYSFPAFASRRAAVQRWYER
jgi:hypothetical protein